MKRVRENFSDKKMAANTLEIIRLTESENSYEQKLQKRSESSAKTYFFSGLEGIFSPPTTTVAACSTYSVTVVAKDTGKRSMIEALGFRFISPIPLYQTHSLLLYQS